MALPFALDAFSIALGLVILRSFLGKIGDVPGFLSGVVNYRLLPASLARAYGIAIIPTEGLVAVCLLSGWQRTPAIAILAALFLSFAVAVGKARRHHLDIPCHCFGGDDTERVSRRTIARLGLLLMLSLLLLGAQLLHLDATEMNIAAGLGAYCLRVLSGLYLLALGAWSLAAMDLAPNIGWPRLQAHQAR